VERHATSSRWNEQTRSEAASHDSPGESLALSPPASTSTRGHLSRDRGSAERVKVREPLVGGGLASRPGILPGVTGNPPASS
jgi:hypothetical protein